MLSEIIILFFFGFAGAIMSLLVSALGVWKMWPIALILAGVWSISATFYMSAAFGFPFYLISLFPFGGAYAIYKGKPRLAWYLLIPLFLMAVFMTCLSSLTFFESLR